MARTNFLVAQAQNGVLGDFFVALLRFGACSSDSWWSSPHIEERLHCPPDDLRLGASPALLQLLDVESQ